MIKNAKCFILILLGLAACVFAQNADPAKVAQVNSGALKEARASWWGFNAEDSTAALKAAINSKVPKLIVDKMASPWIVGETLKLVSNQEIVFEEGVELLAKKGQFKGRGDVLIMINNIRNVTLRGLGKGATLKMRKADYHTAEYEPAEWRHCICLISSKKINVLNLNLVESGGDGIYLGMWSAEPPTDIIIKDVICDGHNRQGISVIAGVNVLIENTKLINTKGTPPEAGIDFEPNKPNEPIKNFVMRNCYSANNAGCGYVFYLPNMNTDSGPLEVLFDKCVSVNDGKYPFAYIASNGTGRTMQGFVKVKDCRFENSPEGILLSGTSEKGPQITLENVVAKNLCKDAPERTPVTVSVRPYDEEASGNIRFRKVTVFDKVKRPTFKFIDGGVGSGGLDNIKGQIKTVYKGKTTVTNFSDEWARKTFPKRPFRSVALYNLDGVEFEPLTPNATIPDQDLPDLQPRGRGRFLIFARKGKDIKFSVKYGQVGNYTGTTAAVSYTTPDKKRVKLDGVPLNDVKEYTIKNASATGFYEIFIDAEKGWSSIKRCNFPVMMDAGRSHAGLIGGKGDFYVYVPEGTKEFAFSFWGSDKAEGLKATVFGPDGTRLWQKDDILLTQQFVGDGKLAAKGGIFKMRIEAPTNLACIEDYCIRILGVPPFIGLAPELLVKPVKK